MPCTRATERHTTWTCSRVTSSLDMVCALTAGTDLNLDNCITNTADEKKQQKLTQHVASAAHASICPAMGLRGFRSTSSKQTASFCTNACINIASCQAHADHVLRNWDVCTRCALELCYRFFLNTMVHMVKLNCDKCSCAVSTKIQHT